MEAKSLGLDDASLTGRRKKGTFSFRLLRALVLVCVCVCVCVCARACVFVCTCVCVWHLRALTGSRQKDTVLWEASEKSAFFLVLHTLVNTLVNTLVRAPWQQHP